MPLDHEDGHPDITGDHAPTKALTNAEVAGQQKAQVNQNKAGAQPRPAGKGMTPGGPPPPDKPQERPGDKPQSKPDLQAQEKTAISSALKLSPEQQQYLGKVMQNPWMPAVDLAETGAEGAWHIANHLGRAWNALMDPNAMSAAQQNIWGRNDALAKFTQLAEGGPAAALGLGSNHAQTEWFWETFGSMLLQTPMYLNPIAGTAALGLNLAGQGPENVSQVPGALAGGLPLAEAGTVMRHPEAIKDPEIAANLFWKSANAALLGLSVLPMTRWLRGLKAIDPKVLEELSQSAAKLKALQPADPSKLPSGAALKQALNLPPVHDTQLVAAAKADVHQVVQLPSGELIDRTARIRKQLARDLGVDPKLENLPRVAPNWTPAQVKLARKVLPDWLPYDLTRKYAADVVPEDPYLFLDQVDEKVGPDALRYLASFNHAHLQVLRGPSVDPLNAAESLVHSLPSSHTATAWVMRSFFENERALMESAGLDDKELMRAIRDPEAYDKLSPVAKIVVNAQKILRRVYADQAKAFGQREGFVPNYDPRVALEEEAPVKTTARAATGGTKALTSESKASRQEKFTVNPDDPAQIALAEKFPDVFSLNAAMKNLRQDFIRDFAKTNRVRYLEEQIAHGSQSESMQAIQILNELEAAGDHLDPTKLGEATLRAARRYPLYHEGLHAASIRSLEQQITALHSHIGLQQALNSLAHDGQPLAFAADAREIPAGYVKLQNASRAFQNYVFHPDFANPLNRISQKLDTGTVLGAWIKANQASVQALMFSPMIHAANLFGRVSWLLSKHFLGPEAGATAAQTAQTVAHSGPWSALEKVLGFAPKSDEERYTWQLQREMEAINAGVIPHFPSMGLSNLIFGEYGKAIGDTTAFESPGTRETWRLPPAMRGIEGLGRKAGQGYDGLQNWLWGKVVWPTGVFAFHVEKAAFKAANPGASDLVASQYAAHMANRWQGAIEPMARSAGMNVLWKSMGFAMNWVRSFYELALPSYLAKSALAAHPELRGYILRQEMQSLLGLYASQFISGNILNLILSGHPQWENDPTNRYYLEITDPWMLKGLQSLGLYKNIDAATGRDPATGGKLVSENFVARQQLQLERMLGMEPATSSIQGVQDMAAGHVAPLLDALAAAFNIDLPQTILAGTSRHINPSEGFGPHADDLAAVLTQFLGVGSTVGYQAQKDASGRAIASTALPPWLQNAPVPDVVKRYAAPGLEQAWQWMTGIRAPYVRAERTPGQPVPDENYAKYDQLKTTYSNNMQQWSNQLMQGSITPYQWRQQYSAASKQYSDQLDLIFGGSSEYAQGGLGLYARYQALYNQAELADGTGVDWGKLDGLQADFNSHLTSAQQADLQTQINQHENAYPALGMYHSTLNAHVKFEQDFAKQHKISYGTLLSEYEAYIKMPRQTAAQYEAKHPEIGQYFAAQTQWEINTWPGRLYSLYYHTSALDRWLIPTEGSDSPQAEEKGLKLIESHYHAPAASA